MAYEQPYAPQRLWIFPVDEDGNSLPPYDFDAIVSEGHTSRLSVMDNPVETGVVVSDHAFMLPRELEIQGVVSDVWLGMREPDRDHVGPLNEDSDWLLATSSQSSISRATRAFETMLAQQALAIPFSVQTGLKLYQDMVIKELTANQDKRTANSLVFRATLREVQFVRTETTKYPPRADDETAKKADKKTTSGEKQATTPATEQKRASVALRAARAAGVLH